MSNVIINDSHLINIGNAIREKTKTEDRYKPKDMAEAIKNINSSGGQGNYVWEKYSNYESGAGVLPENTKLLLHFNENVDDSAGLNQIVPKNVVSYEDGFLEKCMVCDGVNFLSVPYNSDTIVLGKNNFTIAGWYKWSGVFEGTSDRAILFGHTYRYSNTYPWAGFDIELRATGQLFWRICTGYSTYKVEATVNAYVTIGEWFHIALTRVGRYCYLYLNGTLVGTCDLGSTSASIYQAANSPFRIAGTHDNSAVGAVGMNSTNRFIGQIDEFIIVNGSTLWAKDFEPPKFQYGYGGVFEGYVVSNDLESYPDNNYLNGYYYKKVLGG